MSHTLSQPEEVNHALMELVRNEMKVNTSIADKKNLAERTQESWRGSYVSPYRAAYLRSLHNLSRQ